MQSCFLKKVSGGRSDHLSPPHRVHSSLSSELLLYLKIGLMQILAI